MIGLPDAEETRWRLAAPVRELLPLAVVAVPSDTRRPMSAERSPRMDAALARALELADDSTYRQVLITDDYGMEWASFRLIWRARELETR